jgi:hypothetical protein
MQRTKTSRELLRRTKTVEVARQAAKLTFAGQSSVGLSASYSNTLK